MPTKGAFKGAFKGPQLVEETVDIFKFGSDVFRIVYPEQIEPTEGIGELQATIAAGNLPEVSMCTQLVIHVQCIGWVILFIIILIADTCMRYALHEYLNVPMNI